ncbi:DUF3515 family protein [Allobranchiibius sp. CTAmp26]|nr:DUF3515 family protein [Allobranchiibius sp. CTAmp26]
MTGGLLALAAATGLTACNGSDTVGASTAAQAASPACTRAAANWPKTVAQQKTRQTSAKSNTVRAWGDPAIIARCGVSSPGPTTDECFDVDGIDWVGHQLSDGFRFVTYGRSPAIEVLIPKKYEGWGVAAFTAAARTIPQSTHRCS